MAYTEDDLKFLRKIGQIVDEPAPVKVAKVKGTLPFHIHEDQDELFIIHKGSLIMEINNERIKLIEGDVFNVPKGMNHRPIAAEICEVIDALADAITLVIGGILRVIVL